MIVIILSMFGISLIEDSNIISMLDLDLTVLFVLLAIGIGAGTTSRRDQNLPSIYRVAMISLAGTAALIFLFIINFPYQISAFPYLSNTAYMIISPMISILIGSMIIFSCSRSAHTLAKEYKELSLWKEWMQAIPDGVLCIDGKGRVYASNERASSLLGYSVEEMQRRSLRDLEYNPGDPLTISRCLDSECEALEGRFLAKSGSPVVLTVTVSKTQTAKGPFCLLNMRPLSVFNAAKSSDSGDKLTKDQENEKTQDEGAHNAGQDRLTSLPYGHSFIEQGIGILNTTRRNIISNVTVVLIDIDDMSGFNEQHGFAMGDALLATLARCIVKNLRGGDRAYRLRDDIFGLIMPGRGVGAFKKLRERIEDIMISVYTAGFPDVTVTIGFAAGSEANNDFEEMVKLAFSRVAETKPHSSQGPRRAPLST